MEKIIFGLDLSFNSTGICIYSEPNEIKFHRVVYNKIPREIKNINQRSYKMPTNINVDEIILDLGNKNDKEQMHTTVQALICSKAIKEILELEFTEENKQKEFLICLENYIMPSFGGPNSLKIVSGLIALQGYIREYLIKKILMGFNIKILTPSPTQVKKQFTDNGKADKQQMLDIFLTKYDGNKLLPDTDKGKIDDVVDAFALVCYSVGKTLENGHDGK